MEIFIGSSSKENLDKKYYDNANKVLDIALKENDLVFGACSSGIMKLSYDIAKKYNRKVTGICPEFYKSELDKLSCDNILITKTMLESTIKIYEQSDILLFIYGGIGTYYEIFTAIQAKICGEIDLPIIICNIDGYYESFKNILLQQINDGFADSSVLDLVTIIDSVDDLKRLLWK